MNVLPAESPFVLVLQLGLILIGTLASEDLTCIGVGLLISSGQLDGLVGVSGCFLGIFIGDLGLWLIDFLARLGLLRLSWVQRLVSEQRRTELSQQLDQRGCVALLAARFLPGTRLPLYVACGLLGQSLRKFAIWTFVAALLWTPGLVILVALLGESVVQSVTFLVGAGWIGTLLSVLVLFLVIRMGGHTCTATGWSQFITPMSGLWRWEFWPNWLFYLPILPWLAYLSVRYRGILTWTAANPGIPQGGVVGE